MEAEFKHKKMTVAQALVRFLHQQYIERDGKQHRFIAGIWGIFGHGNVSGLGQALEENPSFTYLQARNEQGMVHAAAAYAKQSRRLSTYACTSSIGPGATNMLTAAAGATINRLPVLLLPGDIFAKRQGGPVLQQLEHPLSFDCSVNDCFKPISRFWDRIYRWEQMPESLREAMRVLTSPTETGTVTLCLPQDVQTEAGLFPASLFEEHTYSLTRPSPDADAIRQVRDAILRSRRPLIIAGGGVVYSEAEAELAELCSLTQIPCAETQAGKGSLSGTHPQYLGGVGVTGTQSANRLASQADLVIALGTRFSDFTTASGTQFAQAKIISVNLGERDAHKYNALPLVGDCKRVLQELKACLQESKFQCSPFYQEDVQKEKRTWSEIRTSWIKPESTGISQSTVLGILNADLHPKDTLVAAAGSLPGDMHKLLEVENPSQYHMEYGYSCMGYEIAGALGAKLCKRDDGGEVFVLVGDGSYLMMNTEILTSVQEAQKLIIVLIINHKFACIDNLSKHCGSHGFGNSFVSRSETGLLDGDTLSVDYLANAQSLGADGTYVSKVQDFEAALKAARRSPKTFVIAVNVSASANVPGYETRWNVPVAELSSSQKVQEARKRYESEFSGSLL